MACACVACRAPGGDDGSRIAVLSHLRSIAPLAVVADSFEIIDASRDGDRVAFRTVWAFQDTSGVWVDTSAVLAATLGPDGHVVEYDGPMAAHVAALVDEDRRRRYEDLLDAVHHVYHTIVEAGWYYAEDGIDPARLRERVDAGGALSHPWGITPIRPGEAQIIWLTDATDPEATCALPITDGEERAEGFEWVKDRQWFTCRGRTPQIYSRATIPEEVRSVMQRGGVMQAAPPVRAPAGESHAHD